MPKREPASITTIAGFLTEYVSRRTDVKPATREVWRQTERNLKECYGANHDSATRKRIYDLYLANTRHINNWDLVDLSAPQIVGTYLADRSRKPLYRLAKSSWLWDRRISILATFHFIRLGDFGDTFKIAELLLADREDLIHKAVGWMVREVGKRNMVALEQFLGQHCRVMPRTMLRYAVEKFPKQKRRAFLNRA